MNSKKVYVGFCFLRVLCAVFLLGYIHPDEYFQSCEVVAGDVFSFQNLTIPWEFSPADPNRSIVPPMLTCGIPFLLLRLLGAATPRLLLQAPRLMAVLLSFSLDAAFHSALLSLWPRMPRSSRFSAMACMGSSWVALVFLSRTFSNSLELLFSALTFAAALSTSTPLKRRIAHFACLCVVGSFVRFTFPIFVFPLGIWLLYSHSSSAAPSSFPSSITRHRRQALPRLLLNVLRAATMASGVLMLFMVADSLYFGRMTVAPINNLLYNLDPTNLALHGIHPLYLHATVNLFLLFGPLALLAYISTFSLLSNSCRHLQFFHRRFPQFQTSSSSSSSSTFSPSSSSLLPPISSTSSPSSSPIPLSIQLLLINSVLFPLLVLSRAPHQEARFLLPLLFPLLLLLSLLRPSLLDSRLFWCIWLFFNLLLLLFFGLLHQGSLTSSLMWAHHECIRQQALGTVDAEHPLTVVFWRTYMPPAHLAAITSLSEVPLVIVDLRSTPVDELLQACCRTPNTLLITPRPALARLLLPESKFNLVHSFYPHFSGEEPPSKWSEMTLDVVSFQS
ncbi:MAG: hypothetical protein Q8P67_15065 [archaeon]|nr:hypothetical protein [archaeon]